MTVLFPVYLVKQYEYTIKLECVLFMLNNWQWKKIIGIGTPFLRQL